MINIPPIKLGTEIKTELIPDVTRSWKVGQVLNASVESGGEALSRVLLRIGQQQLEARTPVTLKTGDQVRLLIKSLGETPLLSIQTGASPAQQAADKLRSFIARQTDLGKLVQQIVKTVSEQPLPEPLRQPLQRLLTQLPEARQLLRPDTLKQLISNSGIALEARLATPAPAQADIDHDLKANLLRAAANLVEQIPPPTVDRQGKAIDLTTALQQFVRGEINLRQLGAALFNHLTPDELETVQKFLRDPDHPLPAPLPGKLSLLVQHLQQQPQPQQRQLAENLLSLLRNLPAAQELKALVDNAVARISSQQLTPLTRDADSPYLLMFDLPVKDRQGISLFQFRIEQDAHQPDREQDSWTVTINFNLAPMGPVQARLHLMGEQISTVFHADNSTTVATLQQHLHVLQQAYVDAGLQPGRIDVIRGQPPQQRAVPESVHMVDEKA